MHSATKTNPSSADQSGRRRRLSTARGRSLTVRLGAVVLAGGLVLGVSACGSDSDSSGSSGANGTSPTSAQPAGDVTATDAWARATAQGQTVGSGYMKLTGGAADNSLVAASVPADIAASVELHEVTMSDDSGMDDSDMDMGDMGMDDSGTMGDDSDRDGMNMNGMMRMQQVSSINVPAGATVMLEPGGYHLMLIDLAGPLTAGSTFDITLEFSGGETLVVPVQVRTN
jgi:periplasmic copper chaperone A